jgi:hypothetical protein
MLVAVVAVLVQITLLVWAVVVAVAMVVQPQILAVQPGYITLAVVEVAGETLQLQLQVEQAALAS